MRTSMHSRRRGTNAIEFALTIPIFLVMIGGVIDYGWFFSQQMIVAEASREGARVGAVSPMSDDPAAEAALEAWAVLERNGFGDTGEVEASIEVGPDGSSLISVRVKADYTPLMSLVPVPDMLSAETVMRMEWQSV